MTRDATDRAVPLRVAVHALEVVALAVVAEQVAKKSSMHQPGSVAVDGLLSNAVLNQVRLNGRLQFVLIAAIEGKEAERLQITRDRLQHLGRATHRSGGSREPQPDAGTKFERFGQTDETTGERNDLQLALPAAAVRRAQSGPGRVRESNAGMEPDRLRWEAHGGFRVCCEPWQCGRLRKDSERYSYWVRAGVRRSLVPRAASRIRQGRQPRLAPESGANLGHPGIRSSFRIAVSSVVARFVAILFFVVLILVVRWFLVIFFVFIGVSSK